MLWWDFSSSSGISGFIFLSVIKRKVLRCILNMILHLSGYKLWPSPTHGNAISPIWYRCTNVYWCVHRQGEEGEEDRGEPAPVTAPSSAAAPSTGDPEKDKKIRNIRKVNLYFSISFFSTGIPISIYCFPFPDCVLIEWLVVSLLAWKKHCPHGLIGTLWVVTLSSVTWHILLLFLQYDLQNASQARWSKFTTLCHLMSTENTADWEAEGAAKKWQTAGTKSGE